MTTPIYTQREWDLRDVIDYKALCAIKLGMEAAMENFIKAVQTGRNPTLSDLYVTADERVELLKRLK